MAKLTARMVVNIEPKTKEELLALAAERHISFSDIVRTCLYEYLDKNHVEGQERHHVTNFRQIKSARQL